MAQADGDLTHARYSLEVGHHDWACFAAQQAAEKAVKAVFQSLHAEAWGHAISELLQALNVSRPVPAAIREAALELDKVYIPARYPDAHQFGAPVSLYSSEEAERSIAHADEIVRFCKGLLPGVHPE
jgi:HEPN domain-containing protein